MLIEGSIVQMGPVLRPQIYQQIIALMISELFARINVPAQKNLNQLCERIHHTSTTLHEQTNYSAGPAP